MAQKTSSSKQTSVVPKSNDDKKEQIEDEAVHSNVRSSGHCRIETVENFIVIWLDLNIDESNADIQKSIGHLRRIVNSIKTFTNANRCVDYLTDVKDEKVFVIVSGSLGQHVVPLISQFHQLASIYVFCRDKHKHQQWASNFNKIKGVFTKIEDLCKQLEVDVRHSENNLTPISIISSTTDLNQLDPSLMYSQLLKEILLEDESTLEEKKELVDFCRSHYAGNEKELKVISEFELDYHHPSLIWWYTRPCFLYSMLNKALRTQHIEMIIKMGFVVRDLHRHIEQLHKEQKRQEPLTVYRGQGISDAEFDKIRQSEGHLLAFNNFLSTSIDRRVPFVFARRVSLDFARDCRDLTGVLFQINIDPAISTTPFASIDKISYSKNQKKEILLSMHTVFRIGETKQIENRLFQIDLTLTNDNDPQLTQITEHMRQATEGTAGLHRMAKLMIEMGAFDKAEQIYTTLIETTSDDDREGLAFFHHQLGLIKCEKGDLPCALFHYQQSLDINLTYLSRDDPRLSNIYFNIGLLLQQQGDLDGAMKSYKCTLNIDLHAPQPDHQNVAIRYNNIGSLLKDRGECDEAMKSFERALEICFVHLPSDHPSVATTYNNIGDVYREMGDPSLALSFYQKTLEIFDRSLPSHHPSLSTTHYNLSCVLDDLHRTAEAIEHAERAVDISRCSLGSAHPTLKRHLDEIRRKV